MFHFVRRDTRGPARSGGLVVALGVAIAACGGASGQPSEGTVAVSPPTPTASAATAPPVLLTGADIGRLLSAGTYRIAEPFATPFTIALPDGLKLGSLVEGDVNIAADKGDWIVVEVVENLFVDPCHTEGGPVELPGAPTVDGIVTALNRMVGFKVGSVSSVVVGRHAGKAFELTNTVDTSTGGCSGGLMLPLWTYRGGGQAETNGGLREQLWVIDVDGTAVIVARGGDGIDPIAASIEFE